MKKILGEILNEQEAPKEIKDRLLDSARTHLLLKDLGSLFISNVPKTSLDISETIYNTENSNTKNDKL